MVKDHHELELLYDSLNSYLLGNADHLTSFWVLGS